MRVKLILLKAFWLVDFKKFCLGYFLSVVVFISTTYFFSYCAKNQVQKPTVEDLLWEAIYENNPEKAKEALNRKANPNVLNNERKNPAMVAAERGYLEVLLVLLAPKEASAQESFRPKKRIAFPGFVNQTGKKEYDWIARSLPDALEGSLAEIFVFERTKEPVTQKIFLELLKKSKGVSDALLKDLALKSKADFVIGGQYLVKEENLYIDIYLYSVMQEEKLLEVHATNKLDVSIFDAIELAARELVKNLETQATSTAQIWYKDIRRKSEELEILTNLSQEDRRGNTIVTLAAQNKHREILKLLWQVGADFSSELLKAINYREIEIAKELIAVMPELNFRFLGGKTPLHQAAYKGLLPVVSSLLEKKVPVDTLDMYGFTPLMYAAQEGHLEVTKLLIQYGANPRHADYLGLTVIEAARRRNQSAVVQYLQSL